MEDYHHNFSAGNSFYEHYLEQHAIMTQYFQGLHQNLSTSNSSCSHRTHPYNTYNRRTVNSRRQYSSGHSSLSETSSESSESCSSTSNYELEQEDESYQDDSGSECEYELNVDAIIAMRAAKEELNNKTSSSESDSSIVIVESDPEEFEFVNSENLASLSTRLSRGVGERNSNKEVKNQKKIMEYLYGEKSSTIAGLETAMSLSFERLYDIHQPSFWPVLPVRL